MALEDVLDLTRRLMTIPSTTGTEGALSRFLVDSLGSEGWQVKTQEIDPEPGTNPRPDDGGARGRRGGSDGRAEVGPIASASLQPEAESGWPRLNVLAVADDSVDLDVVFTTHIDTVPPYIPMSEDDEWIHGRGACDAKGILAAQWVAARRLRDEGAKGIGLLAVVGEETSSMGAKRVDRLVDRARFIVDGEPTDLVLARAAKGVLLLRLSAKGVPAHSAYPEQGHSATHDLVEGLHRLLSTPLPSRGDFGPTTVNVGRVQGGIAPNVLAPDAEASVMIRLGAPSTEVETEVRRRLHGVADVEVLSRAEPHHLHLPAGFEGKLVRFGSDVPHLLRLGTPLLVGPGSIHDAHTAHERIRKADLSAAVELYVELGRTLLNT